MKRITLTLLISMSMLLTTGYNSQASDSITIQAMPLDYELVTISTDDAFAHYIKLAPYSVQVYFYTKKYCAEFNVPEEIAFAVAKLETGYKGPDKFAYNPTNQISVANALGAYQLLLSTAKDMYEYLGYGPRHELTKQMLLDDVELNVRLGICYLRWLKNNISPNWIIVCGFYNSGYQIVNDYARHAVKVYDYKNKYL